MDTCARDCDEISPVKLLGLTYRVMAIAGVIILLLSAFGIYHISRDYILKHAEAEAVSISESLIAIHYDLLLGLNESGKQRKIDISKIQADTLDEGLREFLAPFHIIKVKAFSPDTVIAYSTEAGIIGSFNPGNELLQRALSGYHSSKIKNTNEASDLAHEVRFDVDVVETYAPVYNKEGEIVGALEIYQDVTHFRDDVVASVVSGALIVLTILLLVFFVAFKLIQDPVYQLEQARHKLQALATVDPLTSVNNRYQILRLFQTEASRFIREGSNLSMILFDIDLFKKVNDTYGHPAGDKALQKVAIAIEDSIRPYDAVGRYGGEEFLVVLPDTDREEAGSIAERVREAVANTLIEYEQQIIPVTISAGVSQLKPCENNIDAALKRADGALYQAKEMGRNRVVTAQAFCPPQPVIETPGGCRLYCLDMGTQGEPTLPPTSLPPETKVGV